MTAPWGELQVDQLRYMAKQHGPEVAYRDLDAGTSLTFAEWDEQSNRLARFLVHQGVEAGDRISIYLPSDEALRWIITYAATHKAGAIAVPTNTRLSIPELATILGHAEVAACITCESLVENALKVRDQLPCLRLVVTAGGATGTAFDYEEALHEDASDIQVPTDINDLADIMYTSGTTGLPKGVAVRHRNVAMLPNHEPKWSGGGWMHGAPLFTFAGIAFIYNPMKMGLHGMYLPKFDAHRWLDLVERERPPMAFLVPAMAELLVATPELAERDLTSLRMVSIGSAPLAPHTLLALQERLPDATVSNSYGMTEAGPAFIVMPKEEVTKRIGSVGKPVGPTELRIVREDESECDAGEIGEVLTRMSGRQREYYKDEAATANTWTEDGWLRSGDLGYLDDDGFLYLVGRKKDLIIRGGNNVYPTDVEAVLLEHPAVQEAAVIGIPHPVLGEDVAAFVVPRSDAVLDGDEVLAFCAERLADYKRPRQLHIVDELPRNATGKVMKHLLEVPAGKGTVDEAAR